MRWNAVLSIFLAGPVVLDIGALSVLLILFLAGIGVARGMKAEGITLAGVVAAATFFSNDALREQTVAQVNKLPRILAILLGLEGGIASGAQQFLSQPDHKLFFCGAFFLTVVVVFYLAGSSLGDGGGSRMERLAGGVLGGLGGFVISLTLANFGQNYLSRHPGSDALRLELPVLLSPQIPASSPLISYAPMVLLAASFFVAGLALAAITRSRQ